MFPDGYKYSDDRLGIVDTIYDWMYIMSDYGYLVDVPFCLEQWYFQDH